jgi:polyphosphate kinase
MVSRRQFRHLLVAPIDLRDEFVARIRREADTRGRAAPCG